ncbi:MAG: Universal stress protein family [Actinomycetia bacterium]|nr:Universal stress protein family [Actinomycetes bacterium]
MFATVLVPLDMSRHAEAALPIALEEARRHHARLVLLHVVPRPEPAVPAPHLGRGGPYLHPLYPVAWSAQELADEAAEAGVYLEVVKLRYGLPPDTSVQLVVGEPVMRIQAEVDAWPDPLLVLTTGDCTGDQCPPLSETVRRLLVFGRVPILGVRHPLPPRGALGAARAAVAAPASD